MTEREIADWEREIKHAEKMQEQRKSKEQNIKDGIADRNAQTLLSEQLRKERLNERFWRNVWVAANTLGLMIIIYALFHFA